MKKNMDALTKEKFTRQRNNYLKGLTISLKQRMDTLLDMLFDFINPELNVVKTMSGNSALIQISKIISHLYS